MKYFFNNFDYGFEKVITLVIIFGILSLPGLSQAQPKELFSKYDLSKLEPKEIIIEFPQIEVTVWDRCQQCDCSEPFYEKVISEETIDQFTYRNTVGVIKGTLKIMGTQQEDGVILLTKKSDDCIVDTIVTAVEDHPKPVVPCDENCADPAIKKAKAELDIKHGCATSCPSICLISFIFLFLTKKQRRLI